MYLAVVECCMKRYVSVLAVGSPFFVPLIESGCNKVFKPFSVTGRAVLSNSTGVNAYAEV
jgi:hypothetical protein